MSNTKRNHPQYRVTIEQTNAEPNQRAQAGQPTLVFEFEDREDLFKIVEHIKQDSGLEAQDATRVGVALRLLGPVMMKQRKHPLFNDFMPHFKTFMQKLKTTLKQATA